MPEIPSGTVTFLFTDIEGSTRLLKELRARYRDVVADHHRLLRAAFQGAGGHEMGTEGDAFFVAFPRATDAVTGAVEAQRALIAHPWPHGADIRVRMGIHTGEALVAEEGYISLALHRVARIASSGHGGQIVVSHATRDLVEDELPDEIRLRNLGEHRLKDFERPESIFQVETDDLPSEFPALRTLDRQTDYTARIAGREEELTDAARAAIQQPRTLRRRNLLLAALAGVLAAAVSIPVFALGRGESGSDYGVKGGSNALVAIDPTTNEVLGAVAVGSRPGDVVYDSGALWVANLDDETVSRINPTTQEVERTIATPEAPQGLAADGRHGVWFVSASPNSSVAKVGRIAAEYNTVDDESIEVPGYPFGGVTGDIAAADGAVWIVPGGVGHVSRIGAETRELTETMDAGSCCPSSIAVGAGGVWVADSYADRVIRLGAGGIVTPIPVGNRPSGIAAEPRAVWVALAGEGKVARIEPTTQSVDAKIAVGRAPAGVAIGGGGVWVANSRDGTVSRIDPLKNEVVKTIEVGENPHGITFAAGRVWVTVQKRAVAPLERSAEGGQIARFTASRDPDSLDPALAYARPGNPALTRATLSWQIEYATCLKLVNYADSPEAKLVPDAVASMPQPSGDGTTYTFTIRNGMRFSPPSNQRVTAQTFKYAIERSLSPRMGGPVRPSAVMTGSGARSTVDDIVGAEAYAAGDARQISGITVSGNRLRIRLTRPAPDFPERLALPFFCAVPIGTPIIPKGVKTVPSAGPYYVLSYTPGQAIVLKRNPNYTGSRPHHLAEMRIALGVAPVESVRQIKSGRADYALDGIPTFEHAALNSRYGMRGAARDGRQRYFVNPAPEFFYMALNTSRAPFSDVRLRRAANYAIDRRELIRIAEPFFLAEPTDQYLPPVLRGFRGAAIYPSTADTAAARRLVGNRRVKAVMYACSLLCSPLAQSVKARLGAVGIDVEISEFSLPELRTKLGTRGEPFDLAVLASHADTIDPARYLRALFDGRAIRETDNEDVSYFNDPTYNRALDAAAKLSGRARYRAYARFDADLARNAAPIVALAVGMRQDFFSARMGCQVYNPVYGMSLAALCIRRSK